MHWAGAACSWVPIPPQQVVGLCGPCGFRVTCVARCPPFQEMSLCCCCLAGPLEDEPHPLPHGLAPLGGGLSFPGLCGDWEVVTGLEGIGTSEVLRAPANTERPLVWRKPGRL